MNIGHFGCNDIHRLRWSTLPLVYDDSLSYLELLQRMQARLDHYIEELADALTITYEYTQATNHLELDIGISEDYISSSKNPYQYCRG